MKKLLFTTCVLLTVFSCKKETEKNPTPDEPDTPTATQTLLRKFILLDPTQAAPGDTLRIASFTYDSQNRCTFVQQRKSSFNWTQEYFYNGSDTLMYKRYSIFSNENVSELFKYGADGKILSDSVVSSTGGGRVYRYSILSPGTIELRLNSFDSTFRILAKYEQTKDARNNLTSEIDSFFNYDQTSGYYYFRGKASTNVTYDNHVNPFYRISTKSRVILEHENELADEFTSSSVAQGNNITSESRVTVPTTGLVDYNHTFSYTYNAEGYPLTVVITDQLTGEVTRGIYIY